MKIKQVALNAVNFVSKAVIMKSKGNDLVVLVNQAGRRTGTAEKMTAHVEGWLHRAFSVFIFNEKGEMLLQQRAKTKYHFGGLWTNACCSHPRPGEKVLQAAKRRLQEELGFETPLMLIDSIQYSFYDPVSGLTEKEFDYLIFGKYTGAINMHPDEVMAMQWMNYDDLCRQIKRYPGKFTPWFKLILQEKQLMQKINGWPFLND